MSRLDIRLLGGFDARIAGQPIQGFESQKVRALFAFLACQQERGASRDQLAGLLWGEKSDEAARRNLRQALHNLRLACAETDPEAEVLLAAQGQLCIHPELDCWVDSVQFEEAIDRGFLAGGADPYQLAKAARLYTGDFLAGFFIKDSPPFEEWMICEQERLRESAIETFRTLIGAYMARGEYRLGIQYARRLLAVTLPEQMGLV